MSRVRANGIELEYEAFGDARAPPLLLIMGLGAQMILWPDELCEALAAAGHYVIRYDNRDVGLSTKFEHAPRPRIGAAALAALAGLPVRAPYTLDDMAQDALGLLDGLGLGAAHVVGASMGGMIAQILAARHPSRVQSLALIMSTSGNRRLPGPRFDVGLRMVRRPRGVDRETLIRHSMETWRLIGSPGYPPDPARLRARIERSYQRSDDRRGLARQTLAILASGSRVRLLGRIQAPTLVLHGQDDPLVPVAAAHDLARHIPGARLHIVPGMGHDLPAALLPTFARLLAQHAREGARLNDRAPRQ